jgi:FkbM family methyltransferase
MNALEARAKALRRHLGLGGDSAAVRAARPLYSVLLRVLYGRRGLERTVGAEPPVYLAPSYRGIAEDSEPTVLAALKARAHAGSIVFDVGANVGLFSLLAARWVGLTGHVYAFEPAPEALRALRYHIELNDLAGRVEAIGSALADRCGEALFYAHRFNGENSLSPSHARRVPSAAAVRVPLTTVDAFCAERNIVPTLLKIDVEGYELHVLRGARQTFARHRPAAVVEIHPAKWREAGDDRASAASTLADLGYRPVPLEPID